MYINVSETYFKVDLKVKKNKRKKKQTKTINIVANVQIFNAQEDKKDEFYSVKNLKYDNIINLTSNGL